MKSTRKAFSLPELLVVIAIISVLMSMLMPAIQSARLAAGKARDQSTLRQIGIAIHSYHDSFGCVPPHDDYFSGWSGFVSIMPYLEMGPFYGQLMASSGSPLGSGYAQRSLPFFVSSNDPNGTKGTSHSYWMDASPPAPLKAAMGAEEDLPQEIPAEEGDEDGGGGGGSGVPLQTVLLGRSNFVLNFGTNNLAFLIDPNTGIIPFYTETGDGMFPVFGAKTLRWADVLGGTANTYLAGEVRDGGCWSLAYRALGTAKDPINGSTDRGSYSSWNGRGVNFAMCDGSVHFLSNRTALAVHQQMATRAAD